MGLPSLILVKFSQILDAFVMFKAFFDLEMA